MPSFIVDFVQKHSLKESVRNFASATRRLQLPADRNFGSWKRGRDWATRRRRGERHDDDDAAKPSLTSTAPTFSFFVAAALTAAAAAGAAAMLIVHCPLFASLRTNATAVATAAAATILVGAAWGLRSCLLHRRQTRGWRRWKRWEARRTNKERGDVAAPLRSHIGPSGRSVCEWSQAETLALSGRAYPSPKHRRQSYLSGGSDLRRSCSELCLMGDAASTVVMPMQRSLSANTL